MLFVNELHQQRIQFISKNPPFIFLFCNTKLRKECNLLEMSVG